jgi:hypothetical protein
MRSLTRDQLLKIFGLTSGAFDALAFGTPIPATPSRYLDLDLVAMTIAAHADAGPASRHNDCVGVF